MRIHSISLHNYASFAILKEFRLGLLATIVGPNDVGKSNILRALQTFFDGRKIEEEDVHRGPGSTGDVIIEVAFTDLPDEIELENGVKTTFKDEMLLDSEGYLRIQKVYSRDNLTRVNISLITQDFEDDHFAGLPSLKEKDLNERCSTANVQVIKSGRGVTNKDKRQALRTKA